MADPKKPNNDEEPEEDNKEEERKQTEEELEALLKALKEAKKKEPKRKRNQLIAIEIGGAFHPNMFVNFLAYFILNLTIMQITMIVLRLGKVQSIETLILFALLYTVIETLYRLYVLNNHLGFVIRTFGFIFFFGYLTIFFILERFVFPTSIIFEHETLFIIFVATFITIRYIGTQLIKNTLFNKLR